MRSLFRARGLIVLIGAFACGCSSRSGSFLPAGSTAAASPSTAAPTAPRTDPVAFASIRPTADVEPADVEPVSSSDVIRWTACAMREDVILERIQRSGSVFHLTAADENQLRDRGVSERVIQEMKDTSRR
jgi:hypothetical protein